MANMKWQALTAALSVLLLCVTPIRTLTAQTTATVHTMSFASANESIDPSGRVVLVGLVTGDLPGVLTLALNVDASGNITGGEFALNVSYQKFGPPDPDGDGDPSEVLVQRGTIKGAVAGGAAGMNADGTALAVNGIKLKIHSATVEFAAVTTGTGSFSGSSLTTMAASSGTFSLTF